jgi:ribosomal-protein-alanine N-acetyltransferase
VLSVPDLPLEIADAPVPLAGVAARLAAAHPEQGVVPHALRPIYIRRPDAVLARDRAHARAQAQQDPLAGFTIDRAVTREELAAVESLQRQTFTNPWAAESIKWELEHTDVARLYVMRAPDRHVVAYCACWIIFDELHINSLAVDPASRRRGLARRLLVNVLADAVASGAQSATLEVRRSNEAARALYEGLGFRVDGVRRDYYQHPREDALILWNRQLAAEASV